jgi:hypothetical protein
MSKFLILSLLRQVNELVGILYAIQETDGISEELFRLVITQSQVIAKELESQLILTIKTEDQDNE